MEKTIFWKDGFEGKAKGGYYVRNDLLKFFEKLAKTDQKPAGIVVDGWNMEIIVEDKQGE